MIVPIFSEKNASLILGKSSLFYRREFRLDFRPLGFRLRWSGLQRRPVHLLPFFLIYSELLCYIAFACEQRWNSSWNLLLQTFVKTEKTFCRFWNESWTKIHPLRLRVCAWTFIFISSMDFQEWAALCLFRINHNHITKYVFKITNTFIICRSDIGLTQLCWFILCLV